MNTCAIEIISGFFLLLFLVFVAFLQRGGEGGPSGLMSGFDENFVAWAG